MSYGSRPKDAKNWREKMLGEVGSQLDPTRTHFLGKVPYADYKRVLQVSAAHCYLTYPFVLSWSCLEAMANGCLLVAGDTAPVREVLEPGREGLSVAPLNSPATAETLLHALCDQAPKGMRDAAREQVRNRLSRAQGRLQIEWTIQNKLLAVSEVPQALAQIASSQSKEPMHY